MGVGERVPDAVEVSFSESENVFETSHACVCLFCNKQFLSLHTYGYETVYEDQFNIYSLDCRLAPTGFSNLTNLKATFYISGSGCDRLKSVNKSLRDSPTLTVCINYMHIVIYCVKSLYNVSL
jgi:hypothetical protein